MEGVADRFDRFVEPQHLSIPNEDFESSRAIPFVGALLVRDAEVSLGMEVLRFREFGDVRSSTFEFTNNFGETRPKSRKKELTAGIENRGNMCEFVR